MGMGSTTNEETLESLNKTEDTIILLMESVLETLSELEKAPSPDFDKLEELAVNFTSGSESVRKSLNKMADQIIKPFKN